MSHIVEFNIEQYNKQVFYGYEEGRELRKVLNLDECDTNNKLYKIIIPKTIYYVSSTFFIGLFENSIKYFSNRKDFLNHYMFDMQHIHIITLDRVITRVLDNISNGGESLYI